MHSHQLGQARRAVPHARARAAQDVGDAGDAYAALLGAAVRPRAAGALTNAWEPRDPEPALRWLDAWEGLLPLAVQRHVLHSLVFPKARARPRRRLRRRRSGSTCCPALGICLVLAPSVKHSQRRMTPARDPCRPRTCCIHGAPHARGPMACAEAKGAADAAARGARS